MDTSRTITIACSRIIDKQKLYDFLRVIIQHNSPESFRLKHYKNYRAYKFNEKNLRISSLKKYYTKKCVLMFRGREDQFQFMQKNILYSCVLACCLMKMLYPRYGMNQMPSPRMYGSTGFWRTIIPRDLCLINMLRTTESCSSIYSSIQGCLRCKSKAVCF